MPVLALKSMAKKKGVSTKTAEKKWSEAKKLAAPEKKKGDKAYWGTVMKITKNKMHVKEGTVSLGAKVGKKYFKPGVTTASKLGHYAGAAYGGAKAVVGTAKRFLSALVTNGFQVAFIISSATPFLMIYNEVNKRTNANTLKQMEDEEKAKAVDWYKSEHPKGKAQYNIIIKRMTELKHRYEQAVLVGDMAQVIDLKNEIQKLNKDALTFQNTAYALWKTQIQEDLSYSRYLTGNVSEESWSFEHDVVNEGVLDTLKDAYTNAKDALRNHPVGSAVSATAFAGLILIGALKGPKFLSKVITSGSKDEIDKIAKDLISKTGGADLIRNINTHKKEVEILLAKKYNVNPGRMQQLIDDVWTNYDNAISRSSSIKHPAYYKEKIKSDKLSALTAPRLLRRPTLVNRPHNIVSLDISKKGRRQIINTLNIHFPENSTVRLALLKVASDPKNAYSMNISSLKNTLDALSDNKELQAILKQSSPEVKELVDYMYDALNTKVNNLFTRYFKYISTGKVINWTKEEEYLLKKYAVELSQGDLANLEELLQKNRELAEVGRSPLIQKIKNFVNKVKTDFSSGEQREKLMTTDQLVKELRGFKTEPATDFKASSKIKDRLSGAGVERKGRQGVHNKAVSDEIKKREIKKGLAKLGMPDEELY